MLALIGSSARAQMTEYGFHDIRLIDPSRIRIVESSRAPPIVREPEVHLSESDAPPSPDPSLARPITQLALDAGALLQQPAPRGVSPPTAAPLVELTLAGLALPMLVIEARADADFDATHMTLLSIDTDDYARLTVSRTGPEIVGTVRLDDGWYRILPDDFDADYQLLYPLGVRANDPWRRDMPPSLDTRTGRLEARHLQMAWVAETQPDDFSTFADGRLQTYRGPSLGVLDFWDSLSFDPAGKGTVDVSLLTLETERFLTAARNFTRVYDKISVQLKPEFKDDLNTISNEGFEIEALQLINEIPITQPLRLRMIPTGDVVEYSGLLMHREAGGEYNGPRILGSEARAASQQALGSQYGIETTGEFLEEKIYYDVLSETELQLIWRMSVEATCGMIFAVDIDGITGQVVRINGRTTEAAEDALRSSRGFLGNDIFARCRFLDRR